MHASGILGDRHKPCRLCQGPGPLCASHIIPEFFYQPLYDKKGVRRFFILSADPKIPELSAQIGLREWLLCLKCEQHFNKWETVAKKFYFGKLGANPTIVPKGLIFHKLPYTPLKNFWNSILWRLAVTNIKDLKGVNIGANEAELRKMLLSSDPGEPWQFGCILLGLRLHGKHPEGLILQPSMSSISGQPVANVIIHGMIHTFGVPEIMSGNPLRQVVCQRNGMLIVSLENVENIPSLQKAFKLMGEAIHVRENKIKAE